MDHFTKAKKRANFKLKKHITRVVHILKHVPKKVFKKLKHCHKMKKLSKKSPKQIKASFHKYIKKLKVKAKKHTKGGKKLLTKWVMTYKGSFKNSQFLLKQFRRYAMLKKSGSHYKILKLVNHKKDHKKDH